MIRQPRNHRTRVERAFLGNDGRLRRGAFHIYVVELRIEGAHRRAATASAAPSTSPAIELENETRERLFVGQRVRRRFVADPSQNGGPKGALLSCLERNRAATEKSTTNSLPPGRSAAERSRANAPRSGSWCHTCTTRIRSNVPHTRPEPDSAARIGEGSEVHPGEPARSRTAPWSARCRSR